MARSRRHPWLLAVTGALVLPLVTVSAPASADSVTVPPGTIFYNAVSGEAYAGYPAVFDGGSTAADGSRSQRIMLTYNSKQDLPGHKGSRVKISQNGGVGWADYPSFDGTIQASNMVRLPISSGGVITINYEDLSVTETCTNLPVCRRQFNRWMMTPTTFVDAGTATVNFTPGKEIAWARFGQGPIVLDDGRTMVSAMYGVRTGTWQSFTTVVRGVVPAKRRALHPEGADAVRRRLGCARAAVQRGRQLPVGGADGQRRARAGVRQAGRTAAVLL